MQRIEAFESSTDAVVLENEAGLVVRMPAKLTVENSTGVRASILDAWFKRGRPRRVAADLSETRQIDSSGVGLLLELSQKAGEDRVPLALCGLRAGPRRMLERTGIIGRFSLCESLDDAMPGPAAAAVAVRPEPMVRKRSHAALWVFDAILAIAILTGAGYLFWQLGMYRGEVQQLSPLQKLTAGISRRIDAAEDAWRNWGHDKDAMLQRVQNSEDANRRQSQNMVAASEQRMQENLNNRTAQLQTRIDAVQEQVDQFRGPTTVPAQPGSVAGEADRMQQQAAGASDVESRVSSVEEQTRRNRQELDAMRARLNQKRVDFQVGLSRSRELAPGVTLTVTATNAPLQRFDGRVVLSQDHKSLAVRGQGLQQPVIFYAAADTQPREIVVTRVTASSVSGFLLMPAEGSGSADGAEPSEATPSSSNPSISKGGK